MIKRKKECYTIKDLFEKYIVPLLQLDIGDYSIVKTIGTNVNYLYLNALKEGYFCIKSEEVCQDITSKIVQNIWQQLISIYSSINKYDLKNIKILESSIYEAGFIWGISEWLAGDNTCNLTIYKILKKFSDWAIKTYEGHHVRFGVVVDNHLLFEETQKGGSNIDFIEFLNKDSAALISDGIGTYIVVTSEGKISKVSDTMIQLDNLKTLTPVELEKTCQASVHNNVGICLTESGDIYCLKKQQLRIARLNGKWVSFSYEKFTNVIKKALGNEQYEQGKIYEIYNTCLDVSYARTGGCLAIYCKDKEKGIDLLLPDENDIQKKFPLSEYITRTNFYNLARLLRKEIMGIDGATVISEQGEIKRVGAIIKSVNPQSDGGGRQAAAMMLSKYGVAIKISADGYIQIMSKGKILKEFR